MVGQLSLDENRTVRYHGSSSGLDLLTRSKRFDGTFWNLPNPGFWPMSDRRTVKTEVEIDSKTNLPPIPVQDRLLEYFTFIFLADYRLYFEYIHCYIPLFYKEHFFKQLARDRQNPISFNTPAAETIDQYERRIPYVLLFMMFALAARYETPGPLVEAESLTRVWNAGDEYLMQARELLYLYSTISVILCLTLRFVNYLMLPCAYSHGLSWRGMQTISNSFDLQGIGLAGTWAYSGYAVRMAQDLGLHRDPAGWMAAVPALKFSKEEVEVRRRTWWSVYMVDKYLPNFFLHLISGIFPHGKDDRQPYQVRNLILNFPKIFSYPPLLKS